jgi:hypothetical protein
MKTWLAKKVAESKKTSHLWQRRPHRLPLDTGRITLPRAGRVSSKLVVRFLSTSGLHCLGLHQTYLPEPRSVLHHSLSRDKAPGFPCGHPRSYPRSPLACLSLNCTSSTGRTSLSMEMLGTNAWSRLLIAGREVTGKPHVCLCLQRAFY